MHHDPVWEPLVRGHWNKFGKCLESLIVNVVAVPSHEKGEKERIKKNLWENWKKITLHADKIQMLKPASSTFHQSILTL